MYSRGQGVETDEAKAMHWLRLAAEQGNPIAQDNLGQMYLPIHFAPLVTGSDTAST